MGLSAPSLVLDAHLGLTSHDAGLVGSEAFHSILMTVHRPQQLAWTWRTDAHCVDPRAAVLFPSGESADGQPLPTALFVPPGACQTLRWARSSEIVVVWVPLEVLREVTRGSTLAPTALPASPMIAAFRAFTLAIARNAQETTAISRYGIERLLAEMTVGALLEVTTVAVQTVAPSSLQERARFAMLAHRNDPYYSIAELAHELHVSLRHLQRVFAARGTTPGAALRALRTELAESMLCNSDLAVLSIHEIALRSGFTSALQLRRALRSAGLPAPTTIRPQSANRGPSALKAASRGGGGRPAHATSRPPGGD